MPTDKSGALLIVAEDEDSWMNVYSALNQGGRVIRHKQLPKTPSKGFRFLAWSAGMPPKSSYIRKTSDILPENTWHDGTHLRYQESNPRYRWIAQGRNQDSYYEEEDDDEDEDDGGCGHIPGGCCYACAMPSLEWHGGGGGGGGGSGYSQDAYGNWYDPWGNYVPAPRPCTEVAWAAPARPPPAHDRRGRHFARMDEPVGGRDEGDGYVWRDGPAGRVRYSSYLENPICGTPGTRSGVEQYRCA